MAAKSSSTNTDRPSRKAARKSRRKAAATEQTNKPEKVQPFSIELKSESQKKAWTELEHNTLSFLLGSAGSGKTFLAMAYAINAVLSERCSKIVLTRPIVESGERLGFLPGTFGDKVNPYMQPLFDAMDLLIGKYSARREIINKAVVLAPLCYMRGRTFHDAVCIFDEAQNASYTQLKLFLSRFGDNTKVIVTGDPNQTDLPVDSPPIVEVIDKIRELKGVAFTQFTDLDVVRHPLVAAIMKKL